MTIRFRTLDTDSRWNYTALYDVFLKGLPDQIQDWLVPLDLPSDLDSLITLAVRMDNRLQARKRNHHHAMSGAALHPLHPVDGVPQASHHQCHRERVPQEKERNPCNWESKTVHEWGAIATCRRGGASTVGSKDISLQLVQQKDTLPRNVLSEL